MLPLEPAAWKHLPSHAWKDMPSVLKVTQSNSSCSFQANIWNLHPKGDPRRTAATSHFLNLWGKPSAGVNSQSFIKWNGPGLIYSCWASAPCLTCCRSEKDLSNAGTETSITSVIWFFAQEITLCEPIKCWEGNTHSHRKMKNIIAEELFPFYQWNHPVSNSLIEALVENNIMTCSVHIYRGEQKHGGLRFSNSTKKCNCSCWTLHRCWSAHKCSGSFYCWILYVQVTWTLLSRAIRFQYGVWDHSQVIDTQQENNILQPVLTSYNPSQGDLTHTTVPRTGSLLERRPVKPVLICRIKPKSTKKRKKFNDRVYPKLGHCASSNNRISYVNWFLLISSDGASCPLLLH